jgi:hypothetical protein
VILRSSIHSFLKTRNSLMSDGIHLTARVLGFFIPRKEIILNHFFRTSL